MRTTILLIALGLGLAACGDTPLERGVTGGAIGAGAGEVVADAPVAGAALGAGAGVVTEEGDIFD